MVKCCLSPGKKHGITELHPDVVSYVSHATQQRLQNLVEKISETAQQKNFSYKVTAVSLGDAPCCPSPGEGAEVGSQVSSLFGVFPELDLGMRILLSAPWHLWVPSTWLGRRIREMICWSRQGPLQLYSGWSLPSILPTPLRSLGLRPELSLQP